MINYSLPRNIWRAVYPALIFVALMNAGAIAALLILGERIDIIWCNAIGYIIAAAALVPIWLKTRGYDDGYSRPNLFAPSVLAFCAMVGFWFLFIGIMGAIDVTRFFPSYEQLNDSILNEGTFFSQLIALAIIGPILEEMCFRGVILKRLLTWLPTWAAIIIQAALFGAAHLNLFQGIYAFSIGLLFGSLYTSFRSIRVSTAAHIGFNLTQVVITATLYRPQLPELPADDTGDVTGYLPIIAIGAVVFTIFWFLLLRRKKAVQTELPEWEPHV
jgi:membrane protease YdiL (CAAX protease family)